MADQTADAAEQRRDKKRRCVVCCLETYDGQWRSSSGRRYWIARCHDFEGCKKRRAAAKERVPARTTTTTRRAR